jgi:hypothetical protein
MKRLVLAVVAMVTVGCGSATGYHPANSSGGYADTKLADDTFRVAFDGNAYTSSTQAADFGLLRASELCLNGEYPFYAVVTQNEQQHVGYEGGRNASHDLRDPVNDTAREVPQGEGAHRRARRGREDDA